MQCKHPVVFCSLCAVCGCDLSDLETANISISHDARLQVSAVEASEIERGQKRGLLASRKLALLLDLDQTVVHATVDGAIEAALLEISHLDSKEVPYRDDIYSFVLVENTCAFTYHIKLRPGTRKFLEQMSLIYELHIYTMGSRSYAIQVAAVLDPTKEYFQDRILSRDDSGSNSVKSIERLFPCDQSMVVVVDDRADVWQWSPNLLRVKPFHYFVGTGDINQPLGANDELQPVIRARCKLNIDTDGDLVFLERILKETHQKFYQIFDKLKSGGEKSHIDSTADVRSILPAIKAKILRGMHILFSGVIPLNEDPRKNSYWINATMFGAICHLELSNEITHVISSKAGTIKVNAALAMGNIWILKAAWLDDCVTKWIHSAEESFLLEGASTPTFSKLEINKTELDIASGANVDINDINAVFGHEDWDEMDREVADAMGSDSDSSSESTQSGWDSLDLDIDNAISTVPSAVEDKKIVPTKQQKGKRSPLRNEIYSATKKNKML